MRLRDVLTITRARLFFPDADSRQAEVVLDHEIRSGFGSDLMSDVLCFDVSQSLLITGLVNPQVVRTAEMGDVAAILIVRDKVPPQATVDLARQVGIPLLGTPNIMFETCGRLYQAGLSGSSRYAQPAGLQGDIDEDCASVPE
jgi:hypothetical protein